LTLWREQLQAAKRTFLILVVDPHFYFMHGRWRILR
jgi:hypothetical protein